MIYAALLFGIFLGVVGYAAVLLVIGANRDRARQITPAELAQRVRNGERWMVDEDRMRSLSVKAPSTDWDVAIAAEREPERVEYRFLDIPYEEQ